MKYPLWILIRKAIRRPSYREVILTQKGLAAFYDLGTKEKES